MPFASCFEELEVWKEACKLARDIYQITAIGKFSTYRDLNSQIRRAAISIPSNIAEGFEKGSKRDFAKFLLIARGSAGELRTQLYLARSFEYLNVEDFTRLKASVIHISSMLTRFIQSLKNNYLLGYFITCILLYNKERCPSGRRSTLGKRVYG